MSIFITKNYIYFLQDTLTKVSIANGYMHKQFYISFKITLNKRFLVFKTQGLYCHELIYWKKLMSEFAKTQILIWKLIWTVKLKVTGAHQGFFGAGQVSWNKSTLIKMSRTTYKGRAPQAKVSLFFLQDIFKTALQMKIKLLNVHKQDNFFLY